MILDIDKVIGGVIPQERIATIVDKNELWRVTEFREPDAEVWTLVEWLSPNLVDRRGERSIYAGPAPTRDAILLMVLAALEREQREEFARDEYRDYCADMLNRQERARCNEQAEPTIKTFDSFTATLDYPEFETTHLLYDVFSTLALGAQSAFLEAA